MKIEFFKPSDETIPTSLRLKIDDKEHVYYEPLEDDFGYEFYIYEAESEERAKEIFDRCVSIMCSQSYDHGAQWRVVKTDFAPAHDEPWSPYKGTVVFRARDSY